MAELGELQSRIQRLIPMTSALGMRLTKFDGQTLTVAAPLDLNRNHQNTAFGGSLYSVGVMTVWCLLQLWLDQKGIPGTIVIQTGAMDYTDPVTGDFEAQASLPDQTAMNKVETMLRRRGKARLNLSSELLQQRESRGRFMGRFVILQDG